MLEKAHETRALDQKYPIQGDGYWISTAASCKAFPYKERCKTKKLFGEEANVQSLMQILN